MLIWIIRMYVPGCQDTAGAGPKSSCGAVVAPRNATSTKYCDFEDFSTPNQMVWRFHIHTIATRAGIVPRPAVCIRSLTTTE